MVVVWGVAVAGAGCGGGGGGGDGPDAAVSNGVDAAALVDAAAPDAAAPDAAAPDAPPPDAATPGMATIGAAGGTVTSVDGRLTLTVPPNALTVATVITITKLGGGDVPAGAVPAGVGYELLPSGTTFAQAVDVTYRLTPAEAAWTTTDTTIQAPWIYLQTTDAAGGNLELLESKTARMGDEVVVTGTLTHFSRVTAKKGPVTASFPALHKGYVGSTTSSRVEFSIGLQVASARAAAAPPEPLEIATQTCPGNPVTTLSCSVTTTCKSVATGTLVVVARGALTTGTELGDNVFVEIALVSNYVCLGSAPPEISSVDPGTVVKVGDQVRIHGKGFKISDLPGDGPSVTLDGRDVALDFVSDTELRFKIKDGDTSGKIVVKTPFGMATSTATVTVALAISEAFPDPGKVGQSITIFGTNFREPIVVKFNGVVAPLASVTSGGAIAVRIPAGATTGPLTVESGGQTAQVDYNILPNVSFVAGPILMKGPNSGCDGLYAGDYIRDPNDPGGAPDIVQFGSAGARIFGGNGDGTFDLPKTYDPGTSTVIGTGVTHVGGALGEPDIPDFWIGHGLGPSPARLCLRTQDGTGEMLYDQIIDFTGGTNAFIMGVGNFDGKQTKEAFSISAPDRIDILQNAFDLDAAPVSKVVMISDPNDRVLAATTVPDGAGSERLAVVTGSTTHGLELFVFEGDPVKVLVPPTSPVAVSDFLWGGSTAHLPGITPLEDPDAELPNLAVWNEGTVANFAPDVGGDYTAPPKTSTLFADKDIVDLAFVDGGDGNADMIAVTDDKSGAAQVTLFVGLGDGTFGLPIPLELVGAFGGSVASADFDLDGLADVAVCTEFGVETFLQKH